MRIALIGTSLAGKTTLADYLAKHHAWTKLNYTDLLKTAAIAALKEAYDVLCIDGVVRMQDLIDNKKFYRPFINELGTVLGFDKGEGVDLVLSHWAAKGAPEHAVWDCVRFESQATKLRELGFVLVGIQTPTVVLLERAKAKGISREEFDRQEAWDRDNLPWPEMNLDGERTVEENAEILNRLMVLHSYAKVA